MCSSDLSQLDKEEENRQVKLQQKKIAYAKKREKLQQDLNIWTAKRQNANKGSTQWEQADEQVQRIGAKLGVKPKDFMVVYKDDTPPITPHKADKAAHQLAKTQNFLKGLRLKIDAFPDKTK